MEIANAGDLHLARTADLGYGISVVKSRLTTFSHSSYMNESITFSLVLDFPIVSTQC